MHPARESMEYDKLNIQETWVKPTRPVHSFTSTRKNYYTGLIETSKKHFYGRAAAELSFSDLVLGTFTAAQRPVRVLVIAARWWFTSAQQPPQWMEAGVPARTSIWAGRAAFAAATAALDAASGRRCPLMVDS